MLIEDWIESLLSLEIEASEHRDPLLDAEAVVYLHVFESLLTYIKTLVESPNRPVSDNDLILLRLAELKCIHEKISALERKCKAKWDKIKNKLTSDSSNMRVLKPRPDMFVAETARIGGMLSESDHKDGVYKPPKQFAVRFGNDDDDEEAEMKRLRESEMVRAITADIMPIPEIVGDGSEEMVLSHKRKLQKFVDVENHGLEHNRNVQMNKSKRHELRELRHKRDLLSVGNTFGDLEDFVERIGERKNVVMKTNVKHSPNKRRRIK
eukprot:Blabericola_migrator_1__12030@NODE_739_length_6686_cov_203_338118_g530_i0_p4_GENE_NODE_739_length_6686_cov_203_338118_g530_i0NODE_739_length_6686_cov_203_338118_g530_i0_p4_ORF_typecomplete_len266_score60_46EF1_beta_acid/PF10587_9/0_029_NODE_739_length_6686_cov_203_338118_g530_i017162513